MNSFGTCTLDYLYMIFFRADLEISKHKLFQNRAVYCMGQQLLLGCSQSSSLECSKCHPSYWKWSLGPQGFGPGLPGMLFAPGCSLGCSWPRHGHWRCLGAVLAQLHSPCGDVPGLGDISPPSWSATLVSMQDMLPKAQVVCCGTSLTNLWDLLAGHC